MKVIQLLIIICLSHQVVFSQWTIFNTTNSALLDNGIKSIAIDHNHRKWVGCSYGLGLYNDTSWTMYTTANSGLPDDNIVCVGIDKNNVAWIGTNNGGLARFDGTTWTVWNTSNSSLPSDEVKCIAFDTLGNKWIGTANGLAKFNDTTFTVWNLTNSSMFLVVIHAIAIDKNNVKYISSLNNGLYYYNDTTFIHYTVSNSYLQDNFVYAIALDSSQTRWYGTAGKGLMAQHTDSVTWEWYYPLNTPADSAWTVNCIVIDSMQRKYQGSELTGVVRYDGVNWDYWKTNNSPIPSNNVKALAMEGNSILWIGTPNGLARFNMAIVTSEPAKDIFSSVMVYPNPVNDQLHISISTEVEPITIDVLDPLGRVLSTSALKQGSNLLDFPYPQGIYYLRCNQNGKYSEVKKLVKMNE